jgi:hypothetical protein
MEEIPNASKSKRRLRCNLIALAWTISVIVLFYQLDDWRGRHDWNKYRQNYEARVAPLDLQAYIPKPIPDSENFAATPFALSWIKQWRDTNMLFDRDAVNRAEIMIVHPKDLGVRHFEDLVAWQEAFAASRVPAEKPKLQFFHSDKFDIASRAQAAPAVLDGLKDDEAVLDELRQASSRPDSRYPIDYKMETPWSTPLPHLSRIKQTCFRLELRACAELVAGQNENALDDVTLSLYLADSVKSEPFLISYLVRLASIQIGVHSIWEGLAEHRWTDGQLQHLQRRLESFDFLADMNRPLHVERVIGVSIADWLQNSGLDGLRDLEGAGWTFSENLYFLARIAPAGRFDQEKLKYCLWFDDEFRGTVNETSRTVSPENVASNALALKPLNESEWHGALHNDILAMFLLPALSKVTFKAAAAQITVDQADIACALERYRLANNQYPENLKALVPTFITELPNDVIGGQPYKYRRTDDGQFILYSVGWNEKDDGGVPGKTMFDETEGDWVWEHPGGK